jgi:putative addiction module antidote
MVVGKVRKVGNSLVVTIPKEEVDLLELRDGDLVAMELRKAEVRPVLRPDLRKMAEKSWERNEPGYRYLREH